MPYRRLVPWARALLRGQKVLAKARADGSLDAVSGRVEVRYKPNDGRAYQAAARIINIQDDVIDRIINGLGAGK